MPLISLLFGFSLLWVSLCLRQEILDEKKHLRRVIPPPVGSEHFLFGYSETAADLLWLRVLQDMELCEEVVGGVVPGTELRTEKASCTKGWTYRMGDRITEFAPKWVLPYRVLGMILSFMTDDRVGAKLIFEKGMSRFPNDYNLHYGAAYHFIYGTKEPALAAKALIRAARNGGPGWFYSLAAKLYSEAGQKELGIGVLEAALKEPHSKEAKDRIEWRLKQLKGEASPTIGPSAIGQ